MRDKCKLQRSANTKLSKYYFITELKDTAGLTVTGQCHSGQWAPLPIGFVYLSC